MELLQFNNRLRLVSLLTACVLLHALTAIVEWTLQLVRGKILDRVLSLHSRRICPISSEAERYHALVASNPQQVLDPREKIAAKSPFVSNSPARVVDMRRN